MIQQCFFSLFFFWFFFSFTFCCCSFYLSSCLCCFIYVYVLYSYSSAYKDHLYWLISIKDVNLNAINSLAYLLLCFVFTLCFLMSFLQLWLEQRVLLKYVDRFCFWCYLLMIRTIFFLSIFRTEISTGESRCTVFAVCLIWIIETEITLRMEERVTKSCLC